MSRQRDHSRLLAYDDGEYNDDDYHTSTRNPRNNRSKEYDVFTGSLETGSREYGYFNDNDKLESPKFARSHIRPENKGQANMPPYSSSSNDAFAFQSSGSPNFGRRHVISERKEFRHEESRPLAFRRSPSPKLPKITANDREYGYSKKRQSSRDHRVSGSTRSQAPKASKTQDTLRVGDIKNIDLLLTLNDDTTIVVKAVPFKPHLA